MFGPSILVLWTVFLVGCAGLSPSYDPPQLPGVDIVAITPALVSGFSAENEQIPEPIQGIAEGEEDEATANYLIGTGDVMNIVVLDQEGFTFPLGAQDAIARSDFTVDGDGEIFFPYVGKLKVVGLTVDEVRQMLTEALLETLSSPQVIVTISGYRSQRIFVFGAVNDPGQQALTGPTVTVLDAISRAGGVGDEADLLNATLSRGKRLLKIDLLGLFEDSGASEALTLRNADILYIPPRGARKVYLVGELRNPMSLDLDGRRLSLTEAIQAAGGINPLTANPSYVYVIRGTPQVTEIFHLDSSNPAALVLGDFFPLKSRDVVYVQTAGVTRWARLISQVLPSIEFLSGNPLVRE